MPPWSCLCTEKMGAVGLWSWKPLGYWVRIQTSAHICKSLSLFFWETENIIHSWVGRSAANKNSCHVSCTSRWGNGEAELCGSVTLFNIHHKRGEGSVWWQRKEIPPPQKKLYWSIRPSNLAFAHQTLEEIFCLHLQARFSSVTSRSVPNIAPCLRKYMGGSHSRSPCCSI